MSLTEARLDFAAEFITLVVTASALALLILRPPRREGAALVARTALAQAALSGLALVALGGASFLHGSLIVAGQHVEWVGLTRMIAAATVLVAFPYPGGLWAGRPPIGGLVMRAGFLLWMGAGIVELGSGSDYATDALLAGGSVLVAAAILRVGRRSIAVRVAASGAATLLLVVVVLALALSAVISSSVQSQELSRLSARSAVEKAAVANTAALSTDAQDVEAYLAATFSQSTANPLTEFATGGAPQQAAAAKLVAKALDTLPPRPDAGTVAYVNPAGTALLVAGDPSPIASPGFGFEPDLRATCAAGQQGLFDFGGSIFMAASSPECTTTGLLLGEVVIGQPLDAAYLKSRQRIDPKVGMALMSPTKVYATSGISAAQAQADADALAVPTGQSLTRPVGSSFVSVASLTAASSNGSKLPLSLVLADRTNDVLSTRNQLFRTLFLIAFGGTILALGLAVFTGDRITAGLRRLTRAAGGIAGGDTSLRAGVTGDDEVAALGTAFDSMLDSVSAQAAALQAAAEDEARLRNRLQAVVAGMSDALVAVDSFGRITDFNQAAVDLTGVAAGAALGAPVGRVLRLRNEDGAPVGRQLLQTSGRSTTMMAWVVRDDRDIPVAVSSGGLRGPAGEQAGTVLVFRDMRREQEVEQMKTEFLSRIGHELRTPLTGILGYADILLRRPVSPDMARAWYEDILHSARRLLRIVEMLEFFASEGAGRVVLRPEPVDVRALVNGIASSWSGRLPSNLTLGRRLPKADTIITADQRWLTLAVDELIDNAVKFSPEGGRILIKVDTGPELVEISVSDQGMGMTSQHYEVIFGDFVQGDNSDTRRFGGLGLGLAVARRVVEGHGGTITCKSAPGRGTTFVLGLPVWPAPRSAELAPVAAELEGGSGGSGSGEPGSAPAEGDGAPAAADGAPAPSGGSTADGSGAADGAAEATGATNGPGGKPARAPARKARARKAPPTE
ncbi:MAG TPA: ATP-binding protein [Acidimicrobiales bacterium]|jgi:two-component system sensor histidine kinase VicK|nr:ATP-binding protein [Acidimicrobiales bacterium]